MSIPEYKQLQIYLINGKILWLYAPVALLLGHLMGATASPYEGSVQIRYKCAPPTPPQAEAALCQAVRLDK